MNPLCNDPARIVTFGCYLRLLQCNNGACFLLDRQALTNGERTAETDLQSADKACCVRRYTVAVPPPCFLRFCLTSIAHSVSPFFADLWYAAAVGAELAQGKS